MRIDKTETSLYRELNPSVDFKNNMKSAVAFCLFENEDGSEDIKYYGEAWIDPSYGITKPHYIYVLVNPSSPGIVKIGYTRGTVYERVKQINAATGVITPWYPVFTYKCPNGPIFEAEIHEKLGGLGYRINDKREGFSISSTDAIGIIELLGEKFKNLNIKN